jgi:hypothetical protein
MQSNSKPTIGSNIFLSKLSGIRDQLYSAKRDIFELESLYFYLGTVPNDNLTNSKDSNNQDPGSYLLASFYDRGKVQDKLSNTIDARNFLEMDENTLMSLIKSIYSQTGSSGDELVNLARIHNYVPVT